MLLPNTLYKTCQHCDKPVKGRTDKKFCDDYCRNNYNNRLKAVNNNLIRQVNHTLAKNRRILEQAIPVGDDMVKMSREQLLQEGYVFKYHTHVYINRTGSEYFFCYDYGYMLLDNDSCLVVKKAKG